MPKVEVQRKGGIAVLRLCRPEVRNAVDAELSRELRMAVEAALEDSSAICLRAEGSVFCSGGDIAALQDDDAALAVMDEMRGTLERLRQSPVPVIAYVEGLAIGGGAELAASAHLLCCTPGASFQFVQASLHLSPGWGGGPALVQRVGRGRALDLLLSARRIGAAAAEAIGLVDRILTPPMFADLMETVPLQDRELGCAEISALRTDPEGAVQAAAEFSALWRAERHHAAMRRFLDR
ncbi:MAG: enoyl-CoA hydratase/isomerase family protein [Thermaerobacter sp.]|nr:enoyl-CoA hydratase/isomerase family protein [Thermaerobacter sp.]